MSLGGADMQQGDVTYSRSLPEQALFNFVSVHLLSLLFSKCYYYKAYLQRVLTNAGYNELLRRNEVTEPWQLTARGPSCVTAPPGLLDL